MLRKRLRNDDDGGDEEELVEGKGKRPGKKEKELKISEMDEWMDSDEDDESGSDEDEKGSEKEDDGKKKKKDKGNKRQYIRNYRYLLLCNKSICINRVL